MELDKILIDGKEVFVNLNHIIAFDLQLSDLNECRERGTYIQLIVITKNNIRNIIYEKECDINNIIFKEIVIIDLHNFICFNNKSINKLISEHIKNLDYYKQKERSYDYYHNRIKKSYTLMIFIKSKNILYVSEDKVIHLIGGISNIFYCTEEAYVNYQNYFNSIKYRPNGPEYNKLKEEFEKIYKE